MPGLRTEPNTARLSEGSIGEGLTTAAVVIIRYFLYVRQAAEGSPKKLKKN
jgi:hypothetical protein